MKTARTLVVNNEIHAACAPLYGRSRLFCSAVTFRAVGVVPGDVTCAACIGASCRCCSARADDCDCSLRVACACHVETCLLHCERSNLSRLIDHDALDEGARARLERSGVQVPARPDGWKPLERERAR